LSSIELVAIFTPALGTGYFIAKNPILIGDRQGIFVVKA
jgi:hypothetical protein